jgi:hypothetical protein
MDVGSPHCDSFLHTNPHQDPIFETRRECNPGSAWRNAACALRTILTAVKDRVAAATGIIVEMHDGGSISGFDYAGGSSGSRCASASR